MFTKILLINPLRPRRYDKNKMRTHHFLKCKKLNRILHIIEPICKIFLSLNTKDAHLHLLHSFCKNLILYVCNLNRLYGRGHRQPVSDGPAEKGQPTQYTLSVSTPLQEILWAGGR